MFSFLGTHPCCHLPACVWAHLLNALYRDVTHQDLPIWLVNRLRNHLLWGSKIHGVLGALPPPCNRCSAFQTWTGLVHASGGHWWAGYYCIHCLTFLTFDSRSGSSGLWTKCSPVGKRNGSVVKSTCCSIRRTGVQVPALIALAPRNLMPYCYKTYICLYMFYICLYIAQVHTHAHIYTHTNKNKICLCTSERNPHPQHFCVLTFLIS